MGLAFHKCDWVSTFCVAVDSSTSLAIQFVTGNVVHSVDLQWTISSVADSRNKLSNQHLRAFELEVAITLHQFSLWTVAWVT